MGEYGLYAVLAGAGISAGFLNTLAGGGSMLTLPVLMLLGLPANLANGTNRLSIVTQSLSGVWAFHRSGKLDTTAVVPVLLPTVVGSLIGASVATSVPAAALKMVLLVIMVLMATVMLLRPSAIIAAEGSAPGRRDLGTLGLFAAGLYGGFIQAGVGFVLLAVLGGVLRYDLARANALKMLCTLVFGSVALAVFVVAGDVVWLPAGVLAASTVIGSQLGVRVAIRAPQAVLRWVLFVCVVGTCVAASIRP